MKLQEYKHRRQRLLKKMVPGSAALIFAAPEITRNADNKYPYRQNSNFWYFTGFNEPQALLILIKKNLNHQYSVLFNRAKNKFNEIWNGYCLGQDKAIKHLGVSLALPWNDINNQLHLLLNKLDVVYHAPGEYKFADKLLFSALDKLRQNTRYQSQASPFTLIDWRPLVHDMRLIKSEKELEIIRHACRITSIAHTYAMQRCQPGMYEYQLEGEVQYIFNLHGARFTSYNSIVGSGKNSCILHYTENSSKMKNGDMVLIDAGCEYQGYATDVTRTFPVNGCFSTEQRAIYNLVLSMLNRALELYGPGNTIKKVNEEVIHTMITGLVKLGIIKGKIETLIKSQIHRQFLMHNLSHWLGLDVHDTGYYGSSERNRILKTGMVLTIEPGIYITNNANVPASYRNIGVRIEDNIVITATGNENLTSSIVKNVNDIEKLMTILN